MEHPKSDTVLAHLQTSFSVFIRNLLYHHNRRKLQPTRNLN